MKVAFNQMIQNSIMLLLLSFVHLSSLAEELPIRLQVALMSKIVGMERNLAQKEYISIYVLDAPKVYLLLKNDTGFKMGNSTLQKVEQGENLPSVKYDIIYIGSYLKEASAIEYAKTHDVMSLYPMIAGMKQIGSLGLGIKSGKPKFLLDLSQSEAENLQWNAKILKVAQLK